MIICCCFYILNVIKAITYGIYSIRQTMYFSPCRIMLTTISFCDVVYFFFPPDVILSYLLMPPWNRIKHNGKKREKLIRFPEVEREIGNMAMWCGCIPLAHRSVRHVSSTSVDLRHWKSRRLWGLKRVKLGSRRLSAVFLLWSKALAAISRYPIFARGPTNSNRPGIKRPMSLYAAEEKYKRRLENSVAKLIQSCTTMQTTYNHPQTVDLVVQMELWTWCTCESALLYIHSGAPDNYGPLSVFCFVRNEWKRPEWTECV